MPVNPASCPGTGTTWIDKAIATFLISDLDKASWKVRAFIKTGDEISVSTEDGNYRERKK